MTGFTATKRPVMPAARGEQHWRERAECLGMDTAVFFPGKGVNSVAAREICATCPVRQECLQEALANNEQYGIFGGMSETERRDHRKRQRTSWTREKRDAEILRLAAAGTAREVIAAEVRVTHRTVERAIARNKTTSTATTAAVADAA